MCMNESAFAPSIMSNQLYERPEESTVWLDGGAEPTRDFTFARHRRWRQWTWLWKVANTQHKSHKPNNVFWFPFFRCALERWSEHVFQSPSLWDNNKRERERERWRLPVLLSSPHFTAQQATTRPTTPSTWANTLGWPEPAWLWPVFRPIAARQPDNGAHWQHPRCRGKHLGCSSIQAFHSNDLVHTTQTTTPRPFPFTQKPRCLQLQPRI